MPRLCPDSEQLLGYVEFPFQVSGCKRRGAPIGGIMISAEEMRSLRNDGHGAAADEIERLRNAIKYNCFCPCCINWEICEPECTFAEDCPRENIRMMVARAALYGG